MSWALGLEVRLAHQEFCAVAVSIEDQAAIWSGLPAAKSPVLLLQTSTSRDDHVALCVRRAERDKEPDNALTSIHIIVMPFKKNTCWKIGRRRWQYA